MPKQEKKSKEKNEKKDVFEQIKEAIPENLVPKNFDREKIVKFLSDTYEKGSEVLKTGAKKVGEASEKIAHSTKLYYQFNQSKIKTHLIYTKLGEALEQKSKSGSASVNLSDPDISKLLSELKSQDELMGNIKKELDGIKF